jgi:hypothetical protein
MMARPAELYVASRYGKSKERIYFTQKAMRGATNWEMELGYLKTLFQLHELHIVESDRKVIMVER